MIKNGGFPFKVFCLLYEACVCSILEYGGEIFGFDVHDSALQIYLRAARSFLGVTKNSPIHGIISEMNLLLPQFKGQIRMIRQYHRVLKSSGENMSKKVFLWDKSQNEQSIVNTWYNEVKSIFVDNGLSEVFENGLVFDLKQTVDSLKSKMLQKQQNTLQAECSQKPKLRTFVKFKNFSETPAYLTKPLSFIQRKFLAKLRLGCLEIRLETGRWARPRLAEEARTCLACENQEENIENENHFLFECNRYQSERLSWLAKISKPENFLVLPQAEKFSVVLNHPSNVKHTAQYIINIFDIRSKIINASNIVNVPRLVHLLPHDQCPACNPVPN